MFACVRMSAHHICIQLVFIRYIFVFLRDYIFYSHFHTCVRDCIFYLTCVIDLIFFILILTHVRVIIFSISFSHMCD